MSNDVVWHMTFDIRHMTCDRGHMTHDTQRVVNIVPNVRSLATIVASLKKRSLLLLIVVLNVIFGDTLFIKGNITNITFQESYGSRAPMIPSFWNSEWNENSEMHKVEYILRMLRGFTCSSCGGLWPRLYLPFGQNKSFLCCFCLF